MSSDIHALSGAYAVDALDDIERAQFERHLAGCDTCRDEVDSLREASALLAETTALAPPAALRARVLAGIETVRPLPPVIPLPVERRRRRFPALVAAAAVVTLLGAGGVVIAQPWNDEPSQTISATQQVLDAPDAETYTKKAVSGGMVTVTRSASLNRAVLQAKGLAPLPDGKVYALWLQHGDHMVNAGAITSGDATVLMTGDPVTASASAISVEPGEGAEEPTTYPVVLVDFEQV